VFAYYLWLCSRWNFCNRSTLRENISQSTMCYFFETRCICICSVSAKDGIEHTLLYSEQWANPGASTPYKRWSKCSMEKLRGRNFCSGGILLQGLGGRRPWANLICVPSHVTLAVLNHKYTLDILAYWCSQGCYFIAPPPVCIWAI